MAEKALHQHYRVILCYWSASNTEGYRILQYEAQAKATERKVRALICIESDKGGRLEGALSGMHFSYKTDNFTNLWHRA